MGTPFALLLVCTGQEYSSGVARAQDYFAILFANTTKAFSAGEGSYNLHRPREVKFFAYFLFVNENCRGDPSPTDI
ncbi:MAG: hypothetical protein IJD37_06590 [Clostridia bacterium]|nr:hypothetical protein [Clostridia bacterium]